MPSAVQSRVRRLRDQAAGIDQHAHRLEQAGKLAAAARARELADGLLARARELEDEGGE